MSYDRKLDQICPHRVVEESVFLDASGTTVVPLRPISSVNSVEVRLNSVTTVPSVGVYAPATVLGSKEGPFTIKTGVNDTFRVQVDGGPEQVVVIPGGVKYTPEKIAELLTLQLSGIRFYVSERRVGFLSESEGKAATIFIPSTSTLCGPLGFMTNRQWRGRTISPGWTLVNSPNTLLDRPLRLIVFDESLKGFSDYVEINYTTLQQECRRCGGVGVENDWVYGVSGEVVQVVDEALLIQEILKLMYTVRGSNTFHNWYGTGITESIGQKIGSTGILQNTLVNDIYTAFNRWQSIKSQQEQNVGQFVSDREYPFRLLAVDVEQSQQDPTVIFISITVQNRSSDPIVIERGIRVPQPTDLLGSTQSQGIFRQSLSQYTLSG